MDPDQMTMIFGGAAAAGATVGGLVVGLIRSWPWSRNGNGHINGNGTARLLESIRDKAEAANQRLSVLEERERIAAATREKHHMGLREVERGQDSIRAELGAVARELTVLTDRIAGLHNTLIDSISRAHQIFAGVQAGKRGAALMPPARTSEGE